MDMIEVTNVMSYFDAAKYNGPFSEELANTSRGKLTIVAKLMPMMEMILPKTTFFCNITIQNGSGKC